MTVMDKIISTSCSRRVSIDRLKHDRARNNKDKRIIQDMDGHTEFRLFSQSVSQSDKKTRRDDPIYIYNVFFCMQIYVCFLERIYVYMSVCAYNIRERETSINHNFWKQAARLDFSSVLYHFYNSDLNIQFFVVFFCLSSAQTTLLISRSLSLFCSLVLNSH